MPINIKKLGSPPKYANTNYTPATAECSFTVLNKSGIYSPKNTNSAYNDILKRDRIFKFYDGKKIDLSDETDENISLVNSYLFYTKVNNDSSGRQLPYRC